MPPTPSTPPAPAIQLAALFKLRPAGRRWPFAARAALCMGVPVLTGWIAGDVSAGLMATIGAFTSLYGGDRPYLNRAIHLAVVAASFAAAVMLGVWAAGMPAMVVPTIVVIAMVSTFLCNALRIGPPGAYMFALACAAGTGMPISHLTVPQVGLLVFSGGAFAWLAHMAGALAGPRGPERTAVAAAAQAIARFVDTVGKPGEDSARHAAALALHHAWTLLVTYQPARPRPSGVLSRLRALNRELNLLFAGILNIPASAGASLADAAGTARSIAVQAKNARARQEPTDPRHVPLGHHGVLESLWENLRPWSPALLAAARIGVATAIAGLIGAALGLERAYWTMAAAVLMLHQGLNWMRSLQRGIERMSGTLVGLVLAGGILAVHPEGPWLVMTLMLLQFIIEMVVIRNYALAVVFITAAALTIASGGHPVPDIGHLLWVRGVDTFIGCAVGLAILALTSPRSIAVRIPQELVNTLAALKRVLAHAAAGEVTANAARRARRDLQHRTIVLLQAYDASVGATPWHRDAAERSWPTVVAAQRLAYRVLSVCWSLENAGAGAPAMARTLLGPDGEQRVGRALAALSGAIRAGAKPEPLSDVPEFLRTELQNLHDSLVYVGAGGPGKHGAEGGKPDRPQ
ncbi:Inner membrane protein YccS [Pigmentiphaga humi]|uniref:Inner membrane protein YccS n=1 Tax=Pigmentiphaga humi TaxID=2478468 RepID=A0A3P4B5U4_9BURK|nr:FUSC family protein [Pigmentiphaga humi]VCU71683.1 Inner membrane protein YccS [Pigmentiphaga humi]